MKLNRAPISQCRTQRIQSHCLHNSSDSISHQWFQPPAQGYFYAQNNAVPIKEETKLRKKKHAYRTEEQQSVLREYVLSILFVGRCYLPMPSLPHLLGKPPPSASKKTQHSETNKTPTNNKTNHNRNRNNSRGFVLCYIIANENKHQ